MFKKSDPDFTIVSFIDPTVVIKSASDYDKHAANFKTVFPAEIMRAKAFLGMYTASTMPIDRLKKGYYGFYEYAHKKIWIQTWLLKTFHVKSIGFLIRKDVINLNRDLYCKQLQEIIAAFPLSAESSARRAEAKERATFEAAIPPFQIHLGNRVKHESSAGELITTKALIISCGRNHAEFLTRHITSYYEATNSGKSFVPFSLLHGSNPGNIQAFLQAIVIQNHFMASACALPVIGVSPKALTQFVKIGEAAPEQMLKVILHYPHFTSLEETYKSKELGMYMFFTTKPKLEEAKQFINKILPHLWSRLENDFLHKLPASVKLPRLTTSNLTDASTIRTDGIIAAKAHRHIPADVTIVSQWSKPPNLQKLPPKAVIVNYTDEHFPELATKSRRRNNQHNQENDQRNNQTTNNITKNHKHKNNSAERSTKSTISNKPHHSGNDEDSAVTGASAGTSFTKEEGESLFTTLAESFIAEQEARTAEIIHQNQAMMQAMADQSKQQAE
jgi:hypothetical protein